jgi:hypothetical protein
MGWIKKKSDSVPEKVREFSVIYTEKTFREGQSFSCPVRSSSSSNWCEVKDFSIIHIAKTGHED